MVLLQIDLLRYKKNCTFNSRIRNNIQLK